MTSRPRILLVCEFGSGISHVQRLACVAGHIQSAGADCLAAVYDPALADPLRRLGVPVVQTWLWPARRRQPTPWAARAPRGLLDVLANLGLTQPDVLGAALAHYDALLDLFPADIVLCENAFGALLAARGRRPAIAFGTANCLPPVAGDAFALYDGVPDGSAWPADQVLAGLNAGLTASARRPLPNLAALLDGADAVLPFGPPEFDLFASRRDVPLLPPHLAGHVPATARHRGPRGLFVYLHGFMQQQASIMDSLGRIDGPVRLFMPAMTDDWRHRMPAHVRVERRPVPPEDLIAQSYAVLHHGGRQLSALCLVSGVPQVVLPKAADDRLAARLVDRLGLGKVLSLHGLKPDHIPDAVAAVCGDPGYEARARAAAPDFAARWKGPDPTRIVAQQALRILAAGRSPAGA